MWSANSVPLKTVGGSPIGSPSTRRRGAVFAAPPKKACDAGLWLSPLQEAAARFSVLFAVGTNVLVFPFLLAFEGTIELGSGAFALFALCDAILWLDVLACFVTPVWDEATGALLSHRAVAKRYLRSGELIIDISARCPWDALVTGSSALSFGHLARLLTLRRALLILNSRVGSGGAARPSRKTARAHMGHTRRRLYRSPCPGLLTESSIAATHASVSRSRHPASPPVMQGLASWGLCSAS